MTAIKSVMGTEFTLARRIALSLIFSCAGIASGQNASVLPPSGAGSMSSSSGSGGFGAVDYSSSASLPVVSTDSSVADAGVSATPSALTASDLPQSGRRRLFGSSKHPPAGQFSQWRESIAIELGNQRLAIRIFPRWFAEWPACSRICFIEWVRRETVICTPARELRQWNRV